MYTPVEERPVYKVPRRNKQAGGVLVIALAGLMGAALASAGVAYIASSVAYTSSTYQHSDRAFYATESARFFVQSGDVNEAKLDNLDERYGGVEGVEVAYYSADRQWGFGRIKSADRTPGYAQEWIGWSGGATPQEAVAVHRIGVESGGEGPIGKTDELDEDYRCTVQEEGNEFKIGPPQRSELDDCWLDLSQNEGIDRLKLQGAPAASLGGKICVVGDVKIAGNADRDDFFKPGSVVTGTIDAEGPPWKGEFANVTTGIGSIYWESTDWSDCVDKMYKDGGAQSQGWGYVRRQ